MADGLALGVEHSHAVEFLHIRLRITVTSPAAPQVAAFVAFDAVDGRVVQTFDVFTPLAQRAIFVDRYRPDEAVGFGAPFDHIQGFLVRREAQTIRTCQIIDNPGNLAVRGVYAIDAEGLLLLDLLTFIVAFGLEGRIGEPDRPIAFAGDVVGRIERLALETVGQHGNTPVVFGTRHPPSFGGSARPLTDQQPALAIAAHAIGKVRMLAVHRHLTRYLVPAHDPIVGDIADQQVATVSNPHRPFGPAHAAGQLLDAGIEYSYLGKAVIQNTDQWVGVALGQRLSAGKTRQCANGGDRGRNSQ
ncbi:Uncharacterized protein ALO35_05769 [Pseudomonas amygdali pv. lachrymans]|uniref:Uncharacterized protein n=1 Tax=Pseudomonas amygdali pv. lachrymans TaxID=53707 RepID=A0A0N8RRU1_PSEAV|nr:Uncharacterized protein ALO35_05769 [Pseudomonas amygdali pv. lachrymans]